MSDDDERVPVGMYPVCGPEHAFRSGQALGLAMWHGLDVEAVVDVAGNYTSAMRVHSDRLPEGVTLTLVVEPLPTERLRAAIATNPSDEDVEVMVDELRALGWSVTAPVLS
jgi:hypothetical protein